jgi:hypothetical protein
VGGLFAFVSVLTTFSSTSWLKLLKKKKWNGCFLTSCYRWNVCVSTDSYIEIITPSVVVLDSQALVGIRLGGQSSHEWG